MPNTLHVSKTVKALEYLFYVVLLCIVIPIRIDHHEIEYMKYLEQFNKSYETEKTYQKRFDAFKVSLYMLINQNSKEVF